MSVFEALSKIQSELKAPRNLYNSFGKYKYRNAESILEAAKPLCAKYGCTLTVMDDIVLIGSRYYILKARACLGAATLPKSCAGTAVSALCFMMTRAARCTWRS